MFAVQLLHMTGDLDSDLDCNGLLRGHTGCTDDSMHGQRILRISLPVKCAETVTSCPCKRLPTRPGLATPLTLRRRKVFQALRNHAARSALQPPAVWSLPPRSGLAIINFK